MFVDRREHKSSWDLSRVPQCWSRRANNIPVLSKKNPPSYVSLSPFAPGNSVSRDGFGCLIPRNPPHFSHPSIVVVVDSHIQRIVLATEETTVTQEVSHRPIKCQSRLWSQRGTKVNGSHHGDNPLLRPKGSKSRQKVMRLYKQWHRPISKRFIKPPYSISRATSIDSECCRLPTTSVLSKKPEKLRKNYASTSFDQQVQDSQGHTLYRNKKK